MTFALYRQRSSPNTIILDTQLGQLDEGAPADWDVCFVGRVENGATRFIKGDRGFLGVAHGWSLSVQAIWDGDMRFKVPVYTGRQGPRLYEWRKAPITTVWSLGKQGGGVRRNEGEIDLSMPAHVFSRGEPFDWS